MDLQELIARGRFVMAGAPDRLRTFELVDGRRSAPEIAKTTKRAVQSIHRDLRTLNNAELIRPRVNANGATVTKSGAIVFEKVPLARTVSLSYFKGPAKPQPKAAVTPAARAAGRRPRSALRVPGENELLDIFRDGEDQAYEFKAPGVEIKKITKEIGAMLNTREGGLILYGVEDDGTVVGTDVSRQKFDQPLQNSVKNQIDPRPTVRLQSVKVLGSEILVVVVPPWNRRDVYQFDDRILIRKGTNVFAASPDEVKKLHRGEYVV